MLGQFDSLPKYRFTQVGLMLLLVQFGYYAGSLEFNVVEGIYVLAQPPLRNIQKNNVKVLSTINGNIYYKKYIFHDDAHECLLNNSAN